MDQLTISIPADHISPSQLDYLRRFTAANDALLRTALPAQNTDITVDAGAVSFPWFQVAGSAMPQTYFISQLVKKAKADAGDVPVFDAFNDLLLWLGYPAGYRWPDEPPRQPPRQPDESLRQPGEPPRQPPLQP